MKLILKKEYTGKDNYIDNYNCPIACAMRDAGYTEIRVGGIDVDYRTSGGEHYREMPLSVELAKQAQEWADKKQKEDIEFEMELN